MFKPEHKEAIKKYTSSFKGKPLDQKALLKANPVIAKALVARIMSMPEDMQTSLKTFITPDVAPMLKILLPELAGLIDKSVNNAG